MEGQDTTPVVCSQLEASRFPLGPLIFAILGAVYVLGSAPGLTWLDAGELTAASYELGIAHPPGLPLFSLINKGLALLIPVGDVAFRGNLASAGISALAICLGAQLFSRDRLAGLGAALLVALVPLAVLHSTTVEVYAGVGLLLVLAIGCLYRSGRDHDQRWLVLAAFVFGLSIGGHHAELRLFALTLLVPALFRIGETRTWVAAGITGVIGVFIICYLPIRSMDPLWRDWGDPETLSGLWHHFWGTRIRTAYGAEMGSIDPVSISRLWDQVALNSPLLLVLGLSGAILALRRPLGWVLLAALMTDLMYSAFLNPMGIRDMQNGYVSLIILCSGAALSLEHIRTRWKQPAVMWSLGALCCLSAWMSFGGFTHRTDRGLDRLLNKLTDRAEPESLFLVASDNFAAGLAYFQVVQGARPDVAVVVRQHVHYGSSTSPTAQRLPATLNGWTPGSSLNSLAAMGNGWPIEWEWAGGTDAQFRPPGLEAHFPFFTNRSQDSSSFEDALMAWIHRSHHGGEDRQSRRAAAHLARDIGQYRLGRGESELALKSFKRAVQLRPMDAAVWTNLGTALMANQQLEAAIEATEQALRLEADNNIAAVNLGRYLIQGERWTPAREHLEALLRNQPSADAYGLLGVVFGNQGQLDRARTMFERALTLNPQQAEARAGLRMLRSQEATPSK